MEEPWINEEEQKISVLCGDELNVDALYEFQSLVPAEDAF